MPRKPPRKKPRAAAKKPARKVWIPDAPVRASGTQAAKAKAAKPKRTVWIPEKPPPRSDDRSELGDWFGEQARRADEENAAANVAAVRQSPGNIFRGQERISLVGHTAEEMKDVYAKVRREMPVASPAEIAANEAYRQAEIAAGKIFPCTRCGRAGFLKPQLCYGCANDAEKNSGEDGHDGRDKEESAGGNAAGRGDNS